MSTKIYNGFVARNNNLQKFLEDCKEIKKVLLPVAIDIVNCAIYDTATLHYDLNQGKKDNYLAKAYTSYKKELTLHAATQRLFFNVEFSICVVQRENDIYGMVFTDNNLLLKTFFKYDMIEPYEYYNNSDRPDNVTEEEWKERENIWDGILGDDAVPADCMYNTRLVRNDYYLEQDEKYIPSFESRVNAVAQHKLAEALDSDKNLDKSLLFNREYMDGELKKMVEICEPMIEKKLTLKNLLGV